MSAPRRWCAALLAAALPMARAGAPVPPGEARVALVIGNAAYGGATLANPVNDARDMARILREAGFEVVERLNASRAGMEEGLASATSRMAGRQATAFFFYAGHGIQVDWRNYLIPVDALPRSAAEAQQKAVDLAGVMEAFRKAGSRRNIVVLDACRDNPFQGPSGPKGLAQMDAPPGTLLAFATAPGHLADDGARSNGLYTGELLAELGRPGARIEDVFKRVRVRVRQQSSGRQIPWESTSLEDEFCLYPPAAAVPLSEAEKDDRLERDYAQWEAALKTATAGALAAYLTRYPSGPFSELAQFKLDQIEKVQVLPQAQPGTPAALPPGTNRFRTGDVLEYRETWLAPKAFEGRVVYQVVRAGDDRVEVKATYTRKDGQNKVTRDQVWDQLGNLLSYNDGSSRTLPWVQVPADIGLGKRWVSEFWILPEPGSGHQRMRISWELRVTGREKVKVQGREIVAYRVEGTSLTSRNSPGGTVYLVDPGTFLKLRETTWRKDGAGERVVDYQRELVGYRPAGQVAFLAGPG